MKNDRETKEQLIQWGRKEFLEKGFAQASLRNICKNAGVTTGALYFFFENKEDLFASIVEKPLSQLNQILNEHFDKELNQEDYHNPGRENSEDLACAKEMLHCIYQNYDAFQLLLTKARGSKFEHAEEQFVEMSEKKYRLIADDVCRQKNVPKPAEYMLHWFAHTQVNLFVHLVSHEKLEEKAGRNLEAMVACMTACWNQLLLDK
ncbi:TetR/AcrR family transcriptional regulator [Anaerotignum sp.]|uniref:TetR/AcrR family transcriptional regulator n=1 Tax=Anaerotignum sp. TaxID=2039241 RepID=UPI00289D416F|nr:TetR/AcrR family transcriptional regulator [Anaerotignum sp.]